MVSEVLGFSKSSVKFLAVAFVALPPSQHRVGCQGFSYQRDSVCKENRNDGPEYLLRAFCRYFLCAISTHQSNPPEIFTISILQRRKSSFREVK